MRLFAAQGVRRTAAITPSSWRKSSYSSFNGNCIEVAVLHNDMVSVRDSQNLSGGVLNFAPFGWDSFVGGIRTGEFIPKPHR